MNRFLLAAGATLAWMVAAFPTPGAADDNPLLGSWKFSGQGFVDRNGHNWCDVIVKLSFGPRSKTVVTAMQPGTQTTTPAYYAVYGEKIYVSGTNGLLEGPYFTMIDRTHMQDDTIGHCVYQRE